jgi:hypothetical protein
MALLYLAFVVRRLAVAAAVVVGVAILNFTTFHVLRPEMFAGEGSTRSQLADFLAGLLLHFDLGRSWGFGRREVSDMLLDALPADASLLIGGIVLGTVARLAGGALCAVRPRSAVAIVL